jgi:hypothetical protein
MENSMDPSKGFCGREIDTCDVSKIEDQEPDRSIRECIFSQHRSNLILDVDNGPKEKIASQLDQMDLPAHLL